MERTQAQYKRIAPVFPKHRGKVSLSHLSVLNAILYGAEQGCTGRGLPSHFGNGHTRYIRRNRGAKKGVLDRVFAELQRLEIIRGKVEVLSLDSTVMNVHPEGTGALKTTVLRPSGRRAEAGLPSFIGLPRRIEAPWGFPGPEGRRGMGPRDAHGGTEGQYRALHDTW